MKATKLKKTKSRVVRSRRTVKSLRGRSTNKTKRQVFHLVNLKGVWVLKKTGSKQALRTFSTKEKALSIGRRLVRAKGKSQLIVHKKNNSIQTEFTYGEDPKRSKG